MMKKIDYEMGPRFHYNMVQHNRMLHITMFTAELAEYLNFDLH